MGIFDSEWELMNGGCGLSPMVISDIIEELAADERCHSRTTRTQSAHRVKGPELALDVDGRPYLSGKKDRI